MLHPAPRPTLARPGAKHLGPPSLLDGLLHTASPCGETSMPSMFVYTVIQGTACPDQLTSSVACAQAPRVVDPKGRSYNRLVTAINQPHFTKALAEPVADDLPLQVAA